MGGVVEARPAPLAVEESPGVIREMILELERTILDDAAAASSSQGARLAAVEEALVQRKQAAMAYHLERARVERELLGTTRERLAEIEAEECKSVDRLSAEQAALSAKRILVEAEIASMEEAMARKSEAVETRAQLLAQQEQRPASRLVHTMSAETQTAEDGDLSFIRNRVEKVAVDTGRWDANALLDAWLAGDPEGIFEEAPRPPPTSASDAGTVDTSGGESRGTSEEEEASVAIAAQIARLRAELVRSGGPKCTAALRALIEAEKEVRGEKASSESSNVASQTTLSDEPPRPPPEAPEATAWQHVQSLQQQQFQWAQQQQQQQQGRLLERLVDEQTRAREADERAKLEAENRRLREELDEHHSKPAEVNRHLRQEQREEVRDVGSVVDEGGDSSPDASRRRKAQEEDEGLDSAQRRELARLDFEIERLRRSEQLKALAATMACDFDDEQRRRAHEAWLQAQRRRIQALRVDKALADEERESGLDPFLPDVFVTYDPRAGWGVRFDFASGPCNARRRRDGERAIEQLRLVYALEGGTPRATNWVKYADAAGVDAGVATFALGGADGCSVFAPVEASGQVKLVVEVQADRGGTESLGWAAVPVFAPGLAPPSVDADAVEDGRHWTLAAGAWQLPVAPGTASEEGAPWPPATDTPELFLHARVFFGQAPPAASSVDPLAVVERYKAWGSTKAGLVPARSEPPKKATVRVYTLEAIDRRETTAIARAVVDGEVAWTSPGVTVEARNGWMASWANNAEAFEVDVGSRVDVSLVAPGGGDESARGRLSVRPDDYSSARDVVVDLFAEDKLVAKLHATVGGADASRRATTPEPIESPAFVESRHPDPVEKFGRAEGFDVFVDGARGLPDNAGASRVSVKLLARGAAAGDETAAVARADGARYSPSFDLLASFRDAAFDPSSTLVFRLDALDEDAPAPDPTSSSRRLVDTQPKVVGYAYLNVFCAPGDATQQPTDRHAQGYCLLEGAFQLPLHRRKPDVEALRVADAARDPRVLAATLLVRIAKAPSRQGEDGLLETLPARRDPPPEYGSGAYDSSRATPSAIERRLYERRRKRTDPGIRSGHGRDLDLEVCLAPKPTAIISHLRASAYAPDLGFAVAVDGLNHAPRADCFYKVVTVVSPPGLYFRKPSLADDAHFTLRHDLDACAQAPRFADPPRTFVGKRRGATVFFEVRPLRVVKDRRAGCVVDVDPDPLKFMWTALPVFARSNFANAVYVDSGAFLLPLLKGPVPPDALQATDVWDCILQNVLEADLARASSGPRRGSATRHPFALAKSGESLVVRLIDAQLDDLHTFQPPTRKEYAVRAAAAANFEPQVFSFNYNVANVRRPTRSLLPKGLSDAALHRLLTQAFSHATGIHRYHTSDQESGPATNHVTSTDP